MDKGCLGQDEDSRIDIYSATWIAIRSWADKELKTSREKNDRITLDMTKTSVIRGRIKLLKELLALQEKKGSV